MLKTLIGAILVVGLTGTAKADHIANVVMTSAPLTVGAMRSYARDGGVLINLEGTTSPIADCAGFWLRRSDATFMGLYVVLQMSFQAATPLVFSVHTGHNAAGTSADMATAWHHPSTSEKNCRIDSIVQQ